MVLWLFSFSLNEMPSSGRHYAIALTHLIDRILSACDFRQKCRLLIRPNNNVYFPQLVLSGFFTLLETLRLRFDHLTAHGGFQLAVFRLPIGYRILGSPVVESSFHICFHPLLTSSLAEKSSSKLHFDENKFDN